MYLAIDPGVSTGWALVNTGGELVACGHGQDFPACSRAVIELPQVYRPGMSKGDPNDLITLAVRVGRYQERLESRGVVVALQRPAGWKGQIAKSVHHPRIFRDLSNAERAVVRPVLTAVTAKQAEDIFDAVGLAKFAWENKRFA